MAIAHELKGQSGKAVFKDPVLEGGDAIMKTT